MSKKPATPQPWHPAAYSEHETMAIKALATGTASQGQQQAALKWIIETVCGTYDMSFRPDSDRATVFAEGKRHVGLQLVKHINLVMRPKNDLPTR